MDDGQVMEYCMGEVMEYCTGERLCNIAYSFLHAGLASLFCAGLQFTFLCKIQTHLKIHFKIQIASGEILKNDVKCRCTAYAFV